MKSKSNELLAVASIGLVFGLAVGTMCTKTYDSKRESRNYLGRKCIESAEIMSDVSDLKSNSLSKLDARLNARLDRSTLIIGLFVNNDKTGPVARNMLHDIYEFRLKFPNEIQDKVNKDKIESALAVGKNFNPSLGEK